MGVDSRNDLHPISLERVSCVLLGAILKWQHEAHTLFDRRVSTSVSDLRTN